MSPSRNTSAPLVLGIAGGAAAAVALFLPWYDIFGDSASAFEVYERADVYLLVLCAAGVLITAGNVARRRAWFPVSLALVGGLALSGPLMLRFEAGFGKDANDAISYGWYAYLLGAALMCVAAVLAFRGER